MQLSNQESEKKQEFYKSLFRFHRDRGTEFSRLPILGKKEVDLYEFYNLVQEIGGFLMDVFYVFSCLIFLLQGVRVCFVDKKWPEVVTAMGVPKSVTNAGFSLRLIYQKYLMDYERVFALGLPNIPPPRSSKGSMPVPDYLPQNVGLEDPYEGQGRAAEKQQKEVEETKKRGRPADGGDVSEAQEETEMRRELGQAVKRISLSLQSKNDEEIDWALSVLLVQVRNRR